MELTPDQQALVARANIFEEGLKSAFWKELLALIENKRDSAILSSRTNNWDAGFAAAMVDLTKEIYGVVSIKQAILKELAESQKPTGDNATETKDFISDPPQTVE